MDNLPLPTSAEIEQMAGPALVTTYNHFASTAGENPVKKFSTRSVGVKRLTAIAEALRARGATQASAPVEFPVVATKDATPLKTEAVKPQKAAKAKVAKAAAAKPAKAAAVKPAKAAAVKPAKVNGTTIAIGTRGTLGARLRELIREGLDNAAIWAIVQLEYKLDDNKRGYVSGQSVYMEKRGL